MVHSYLYICVYVKFSVFVSFFVFAKKAISIVHIFTITWVKCLEEYFIFVVVLEKLQCIFYQNNNKYGYGKQINWKITKFFWLWLLHMHDTIGTPACCSKICVRLLTVYNCMNIIQDSILSLCLRFTFPLIWIRACKSDNLLWRIIKMYYLNYYISRVVPRRTVESSSGRPRTPRGTIHIFFRFFVTLFIRSHAHFFQ